MFSVIVQAIEQSEMLAAGAQKLSRSRIPSSSRVSRQSAEKPGAATRPPHAPPWISGERRIGRRLEPLGAAEARLERDIDIVAERFGQQPSGLPAVAMIGSPASSVRCGIPWKLRRRRSGVKSSASSWRDEIRAERLNIERIVIVRR